MKSGPSLKKVSKGDPYRASHQNKIVDAVNNAANLAVDGASGYALASGQYLFVPSEEWCYAKITAKNAGNNYDWTEQYPESGGGWADGARSGTESANPAIEANEAVAADFPVYAILRLEPASNAWIFFLDQCS